MCKWLHFIKRSNETYAATCPTLFSFLESTGNFCLNTFFTWLLTPYSLPEFKFLPPLASETTKGTVEKLIEVSMGITDVNAKSSSRYSRLELTIKNFRWVEVPSASSPPLNFTYICSCILFLFNLLKSICKSKQKQLVTTK